MISTYSENAPSMSMRTRRSISRIRPAAYRCPLFSRSILPSASSSPIAAAAHPEKPCSSKASLSLFSAAGHDNSSSGASSCDSEDGEGRGREGVGGGTHRLHAIPCLRLRRGRRGELEGDTADGATQRAKKGGQTSTTGTHLGFGNRSFTAVYGDVEDDLGSAFAHLSGVLSHRTGTLCRHLHAYVHTCERSHSPSCVTLPFRQRPRQVRRSRRCVR